jgi:hypothetical protein
MKGSKKQAYSKLPSEERLPGMPFAGLDNMNGLGSAQLGVIVNGDI